MKRIWSLFVLTFLTGCELEGRTMGTQLAQGRDIGGPHIVWTDERPVVLFDRATEEKTELHAIPFDGAGADMVWDQLSTVTTWLTPSGYLVAEQFPNIALFSLQSAEVMRTLAGQLDGLQGDSLLFHQGVGVSTASFLAQLPSGDPRELGHIVQQWFAPEGRLYYLSNLGIFRTLDATAKAPETADRLASRFLVARDQRYAVVRERQDTTSNLPAEARDRLLELPSLRERALLPLADRQCQVCAAWLGFSPDCQSFFYAENQQSEASIIYQMSLDALEVDTGKTRPGTVANALLWSPGGDMGLLGEQLCASDQSGCRALYRSIMRPGPTFEPIVTSMAAARFFPDGKYLLFEDALGGGRLMAASTEALSPDPAAAAASLSPEGSLLDGSIIDADTDTVVFWARPAGGRNSVNLMKTAARGNLYAATAPDFSVRRLAEAADSVAVGRGYALALVRFSPQDLTGDLVLFDLHSGREQPLAAPVASFWVTSQCPTPGSPPLSWQGQDIITRWTEIGQGCADSSLLLTFVVRGRVKSSKDGLWSLTVPL
jgi:hypothetical protein